MRIQNGTLVNVVEDHLCPVIERTDDSKASFVDDHHLVDLVAQLLVVIINQDRLLVSLLGNHVHSNVHKYLLGLILKVIDLFEARHEEQTSFIVIIFHQVLNQVALEQRMSLKQLLEILVHKVSAFTILFCHDCRSSFAAEKKRYFSKEVTRG